jgi:hypothetical protein
MAATEREEPRRKVVVVPVIKNNDSMNILWAIVASFISLVAHALLIFLIMQIDLGGADAAAEAAARAQAGKIKPKTEVDVDKKEEKDPDLSDLELGPRADLQSNLPLERIDEVTVPGEVRVAEAPGIVNAPEGPPKNVPPPPGSGGGDGFAPLMAESGHGSPYGSLPGGWGGQVNILGARGLSGAARDKFLKDGGGNELSEQRVAAGLNWLALHQSSDGHWSCNEFHLYARDKPYPAGKSVRCNCSGQGRLGPGLFNDTAATAFALLPFLASGQTHRPPGKDQPKVDYHKGIGAAINWLIAHQGKDGAFASGGGNAGIYAHGLATIAMCEAYGLTSDPLLKLSAQRAINYIVDWQDPVGGGWRYGRREAGDLSVTGWQLMALKSGQMCGLQVPAQTLKLAEKFLDACESSDKGGFGYLPASGETPAMTATGLLCRQYLGINPRNPALINGVEKLKRVPPAAANNFYYLYYATQVMHHMGGESWQFWNLGPSGKGTDGIRDYLISKSDYGNDPRTNHQAGSWAPQGGGHVETGGRIMSTSMALLCLEVYYRHLPLYRSDLGVVKDPK